MSKLVVLIPVLGRPQRAQMALDGFKSTTPDVRVVFIPDPDDDPEIDAIIAAGGEILFTLKANYAHKINTAVKLTKEPLIFLGADDLIPSEDWFEKALAHMEAGVEVVGVNDMIKRGRAEHTTHFLMTRHYAELPVITGERGPLCELYDHSCIDDELIETAKHRNAYAYAEDSHVTHLHPDNNTAPLDDTYRKGRAKLREDRILWKSRKTWYLEPRL
jgi:Glycosyl transferase family 2